MIYTVTLNPALDYAVYLPDFRVGELNRTGREVLSFGGKGINVSAVLAALGEPTIALGFVAGATGQMLCKMLEAAAVGEDFIRLPQGETRINVKIKADTESEINATGPHIDEKSLECLFAQLARLKKGDTLVLAGSVPPSLPRDVYQKMAEIAVPRGVRLVVDAERDLLLPILFYRPCLVKPNKAELAAIVGRVLATDAEIEAAARELQLAGAENVLVSLGADGALLLDKTGKVHRAPAARGQAVNTVGAGDSMVAGFLYGVAKGYPYALRMGIAAGGATAFGEGLADATGIYALLRQM
ncbi:MAG: 1-phosphofructokinase [Clostridia bacterium]|nr:1-phosphofructokinase [Clostridia bacterium]